VPLGMMDVTLALLKMEILKCVRLCIARSRECHIARKRSQSRHLRKLNQMMILRIVPFGTTGVTHVVSMMENLELVLNRLAFNKKSHIAKKRSQPRHLRK
jgi:hypothetical protein